MILKETFAFAITLFLVAYGNTKNITTSLGISIATFLVLLILWFIPLTNKLMTYFCSIVWALFIGGIVVTLNIIAGIISGIAVFIISVFLHKTWFYSDTSDESDF